MARFPRKPAKISSLPDTSKVSWARLSRLRQTMIFKKMNSQLSWALSNNNAEIRRVKERIAALTRQRELGYAGWEFAGGRVEANTADNRLQIFFEEKPDEETRSTLKSNGFRWAPSAGAWQRQLNDNAIYAAGRVDCIRPLTDESPYELQKRVRLGRQVDAGDFEPVSEENSQEEPDQDHEMCMG